jgi:hypothetical protein
MESSGLVWALWRKQDASFDIRSDLDVVSSMPAHLLLRSLRPVLLAAGFRVVLHSNYDIGGAEAVWFLTSTGTLIHLDFVADPKGIGRLAIPTERAMASIQALGDIPWVGPVWEMGYRVSKFVGKDKVQDLEGIGRSGVPRGLESVLDAIFGGKGEGAYRALVGNKTAIEWKALLRPLRWGRLVARVRRGGLMAMAGAVAARLWSRVRWPAGTWVHLSGQLVAPRLGPLEGLMTEPPSRLGTGPRAWWAIVRSRVSVLRPKLVVTYSANNHPGRWAPVRCIENLEAIVPILEAKAWQRIR